MCSCLEKVDVIANSLCNVNPGQFRVNWTMASPG